MTQYHLYLTKCPNCGHHHLIRWGYYKRKRLPAIDLIKIQRIRCKKCGKTTNVLPSFLLANKSYMVIVLKKLIQSYNSSPTWYKQMNLAIDELSTAYRWLNKLKQQAVHSLPLIKNTLVKLSAKHKTNFKFKAEPTNPLLDKDVLIQFQNVAQQLVMAAVYLVNDKSTVFSNSFSFVNYFLSQMT
ncbi:MAG: IS1 family transposase [Candidatus Omnitrophica bacterium]|nr:IS1 family transposase [Candidatus Omnitrophota bacterium]